MDFSEDTLDSQYALGKVAAHVFLIRTGTFHSIVGTSTFWNIRIVFRDKYDFSIFDYKKNGIIKTFINNNFGYNLQDTEEIKGFITPYIWYLAINIPYIYLCTHDKNVY